MIGGITGKLIKYMILFGLVWFGETFMTNTLIKYLPFLGANGTLVRIIGLGIIIVIGGLILDMFFPAF